LSLLGIKRRPFKGEFEKPEKVDNPQDRQKEKSAYEVFATQVKPFFVG
jgi:hypothetical protein